MVSGDQALAIRSHIRKWNVTGGAISPSVTVRADANWEGAVGDKMSFPHYSNKIKYRVTAIQFGGLDDSESPCADVTLTIIEGE